MMQTDDPTADDLLYVTEALNEQGGVILDRPCSCCKRHPLLVFYAIGYDSDEDAENFYEQLEEADPDELDEMDEEEYNDFLRSIGEQPIEACIRCDMVHHWPRMDD